MRGFENYSREALQLETGSFIAVRFTIYYLLSLIAGGAIQEGFWGVAAVDEHEYAEKSAPASGYQPHTLRGGLPESSSLGVVCRNDAPQVALPCRSMLFKNPVSLYYSRRDNMELQTAPVTDHTKFS